MPVQDGGWTDEEQSAGGQPAPEGGQDHTIGRAPARWSSGASQDEQLLAEDEELEIPIGYRAAADDEDADQQPEEGVEESQEHWAASVGVSAVLVKPPTACRGVEARLSNAGGEAVARGRGTPISTPHGRPEPHQLPDLAPAQRPPERALGATLRANREARGNEKVDVRLGGVYALEQIARDALDLHPG